MGFNQFDLLIGTNLRCLECYTDQRLEHVVGPLLCNFHHEQRLVCVCFLTKEF